jgi:hypothetical protein
MRDLVEQKPVPVLAVQWEQLNQYVSKVKQIAEWCLGSLVQPTALGLCGATAGRKIWAEPS